jgi:hypothetical protein
MRPERLFTSGALLCTVGAFVACGGDSTGPKTNALTALEAQQVAVAIFTEVSKALATVGATAPTGASRSVAAMPTQPFSSNCTNGGTITGTYTFTNGLDNQGSGTVTGSMTITPNACKVSTGSRVIAVGGSINFTYSLSYAKYAQSGNFTFHGGGGFTWEGGSCPMDYTVTLTPQGKETVSGTLCGQSINFGT